MTRDLSSFKSASIVNQTEKYIITFKHWESFETLSNKNAFKVKIFRKKIQTSLVEEIFINKPAESPQKLMKDFSEG